MTKDEIRMVLDDLLDKESDMLSSPTVDDWFRLEKQFNCKFPSEFISFIDLMSEYSFPGDILNVSDTGTGTNGNDTIQLTYEYELLYGQWSKELIPFYSVGNGDYFCINANECPFTGVYYHSHGDNRLIKEADSFEKWLAKLPDFLA